MEILLNGAVKLERGAFLGAQPYERTKVHRGHANGYKLKQVWTRVGELAVRSHQVRGVEGEGFYPGSMERGVRSERALKLAVAEMYVQGALSRKMAQIAQELCGLDVSSSQVSRAAAALDTELEAWRSRPLGCVRYLILDARYEKVRHGGSVVDVAVLLAAGVLPDGRSCLLGFSVSLSEAEIHWRSYLETLQQRGLHGVELVTGDDHAGLTAALAARLTGVPRQRCQFHLQQNTTAYVPRVSMRKEVARDIRSVFDAPDRKEADRQLGILCKRWKKDAPRLAGLGRGQRPRGPSSPMKKWHSGPCSRRDGPRVG